MYLNTKKIKIQGKRRKTLNFFKTKTSTRINRRSRKAVKMKFEGTRKEFLAEKLENAIPLISDLLDKGYQVEICRSRSGIKLYSCKKQFQMINRGIVNANEASH